MYTQPRCYTNEKPLNLKTLLRFWSVGVEKTCARELLSARAGGGEAL